MPNLLIPFVAAAGLLVSAVGPAAAALAPVRPAGFKPVLHAVPSTQFAADKVLYARIGHGITGKIGWPDVSHGAAAGTPTEACANVHVFVYKAGGAGELAQSVTAKPVDAANRSAGCTYALTQLPTGVGLMVGAYYDLTTGLWAPACHAQPGAAGGAAGDAINVPVVGEASTSSDMPYITTPYSFTVTVPDAPVTLTLDMALDGTHCR